MSLPTCVSYKIAVDYQYGFEFGRVFYPHKAAWHLMKASWASPLVADSLGAVTRPLASAEAALCIF